MSEREEHDAGRIAREMAAEDPDTWDGVLTAPIWRQRALAAEAKLAAANEKMRKHFLWAVYHAVEWSIEGDDPRTSRHDHACMRDGEYAAQLFVRLGLADPTPRGMLPRPAMWEAMEDLDEDDVPGLWPEE